MAATFEIVTDTTTADVADVATIAGRLTALEQQGDYLERLLTGILADLDDDPAA